MPRPRDLEMVRVDRWLEAWGTWARGSVGSVGFPSRSPLGRCIDEGPRPPDPAPRVVDVDSMVEAIEGAVVRAPSRIREVIVTHWATHAHLPVELQARRLGTSRTGLHAELQVARAFILGSLIG